MAAPSRGFTVVELLVVVAVVAILVTLVLPSLKRGIDTARTTKCLGNLRQIAGACIAYSGDNDGALVPYVGGNASDINSSVTWRSLVMPYLGVATNGYSPGGQSVFRCPADKIEMQRSLVAWDYQTGGHPSSYGINQTWFTTASVTVSYPGFHDYYAVKAGHRYATVPHPADTLFLCDVGEPDSITLPPKQWIEKQRTVSAADFGYARLPPVWAARGWCAYPRHPGGRVNAAFYDGHCASLDMANDIIAHPPGDPNCLFDYH